jgi:hypothetical protein
MYIIKTMPSVSVSNAPFYRSTAEISAFYQAGTNRISITFTLGHAEKAQISMHDMSGAKVADIANKHFSSGTNKILLKNQNYAPGAYLITIKTNTETQAGRITVLK